MVTWFLHRRIMFTTLYESSGCTVSGPMYVTLDLSDLPEVMG